MGFLRKALISVAVLGAWAGVGSALFVLVTPGEERVQAMLKVGAVGNRRWGGRAGGVTPALGAGTANLSPAGDAGAGLTEPGRGGQDQAVGDGRSAGGSCHAGQRDLEEELAERRRREVSVSRDLHPWALGAPLRHRRRRRPCRDLAGSPGSGSCRRVSTPPPNPALTARSCPRGPAPSMWGTEGTSKSVPPSGK